MGNENKPFSAKRCAACSHQQLLFTGYGLTLSIEPCGISAQTFQCQALCSSLFQRLPISEHGARLGNIGTTCTHGRQARKRAVTAKARAKVTLRTKRENHHIHFFRNVANWVDSVPQRRGVRLRSYWRLAVQFRRRCVYSGRSCHAYMKTALINKRMQEHVGRPCSRQATQSELESESLEESSSALDMSSILRLVSAASPEGFDEELATATPSRLTVAVPWEPPSATSCLSFFSHCLPLRWTGSLTFRVDGAGPSSFLQLASNCEMRPLRYPRDRSSCLAWSRLQPDALQFATRLDGFALGAMLAN